MIQDKQILIDNILIHYRYTTTGKSKYNILLLHGWRSDCNVWIRFMNDSHLSDMSLYALDFPGFGKSELPKKPYQISNYAEIVRLFINKLGLKTVILIGHSFGGRVSIKLGSQEKNTFLKAIILVDSAGIAQKSSAKSIKMIGAKIVKPFFIPPFMQTIRNRIYTMINSEDYIATPELKETYLNIIREDLTPLLTRITVPVLLFWGDKDTDTPLSFAYTMQNYIKNSRLVIAPAAGHFSFLDAPRYFNKTVTTFIADL